MDFSLRIAGGMCACAWEPNTTVEQYNTMMSTISAKGYDVTQVIEREGRLILRNSLQSSVNNDLLCNFG